MLIVRATKKLLDRMGPPTLRAGEESSTVLGEWYATAWFWKPQVALFVNEQTLLPVLVPLAPAASLPTRFAGHLAGALTAHGVPGPFIAAELERMREVRTAKTASRSIVGIMNEFTFLAEHYTDDGPRDLLDLAMRLARTPCSPLYQRHVSPDRELAALVRSQGDQPEPRSGQGV